MTALSLRSSTLLALLGTVALLGAGCSRGDGSDAASARSPAAGRATEQPGHVHDIAIDPGSDDIYIATHTGVLRVVDGRVERPSEARKDTVALAVVGPGHIVSSGHTDQSAGMASNLGLVESVDAAQSWTTTSLDGVADFHRLDVAGDRLYGYDAQRRTLMVTTNLRTWKGLSVALILDMAAHPQNPAQLLLATPDGIRSLDTPGRPQAVGGRSDISLIDWPTHDTVVATTDDRRVLVSTDQGATWEQTAVLDDDPRALDASGPTWLVATSAGLYASQDDGRTWTKRVELGL